MSRPLLFSSLAVPALLAAASSAAAQTGYYTAAQAARGRAAYATHCEECHGADLDGGSGPALRGPLFGMFWANGPRTPADLFHELRTTMPRPGAGTLPAETYLDLFAYILQRNGVPAGGTTLTASREALSALPLAGTTPSGPVMLPQAPAFIGPEVSVKPTGKGPSQKELNQAGTSTDWLYHTHDYAGTRHSPLEQITPQNAGQMGLVCRYKFKEFVTFQTGPIVYRGTMYVTTPRTTVAIDAATCAERWRHIWDPKDIESWPNNRGVAIKDGYVVRGTADGYLVALDAGTGAQLWARRAGNPQEGETFTMPPLIYEDLVLVGPAGSENNIRGWIGAFRLSDGAPVWRFNTVPRDGEAGSETWANPYNIPTGGGAIWTPLSLDPESGELFVAVTNPAPDFPAQMRPGRNLYTNAMVVLDVRTGKLKWYDQLVPNDSHDYDLTQVSPLISVRSGGKERNVVVASGKDGLLHTIDREGHSRLTLTTVTTRSNVQASLSAKEPVRFCPGSLGGVEWNGPAWSPRTNLLYVPAVDWCQTTRLDDTVRYVPGANYMGGTMALDSTRQGWLTAVDASTGKVRWRYRSAEPMVAAVTTTAGGVVFTGEVTGHFLALDAQTGKELFRHDTGAPIGGGVVTYEAGGRQYVATTSGRASVWFGIRGTPQIMIYALPKTGGSGSP